MKDYNDFFDEWDLEQSRKLEERPMCDVCGDRIQDDYLYRINGDCICPDCIEKYLDIFREEIID